MAQTMSPEWMTADQDQKISDAVQREGARLRSFIRRRVPDEGDAEDILQDVLYELVVAYRLMKPVEQAGAWLFRVARNKIIDRFRKKKPQSLEAQGHEGEGESLNLEELLPSPERGPEAEYARTVLLHELEDALGELPKEQREVFLAHEVEGKSFKEIAAETGLSMNTLLSRKHYAVVHLRTRLEDIYNELFEGNEL